MKKRYLTWCPMLFSIGVMVLWAVFFQGQYMLAGLLIAICAILPYLISFERSRPKARDIVLTAVLIALCVAGRAVLFMVPQIKPTCAIVMITGICLGSVKGFLVGALSALLSNFLFSQGPWTPFQMLAMGMTGWLAGMVFAKDKVPTKWKLCVFGWFTATVIYGLLVEGSSFFFLQPEEGAGSVVSVYLLGLPANIVHGIGTVVFLLLFGQPLIRKLLRIRQKYALEA